MVKNPPAMGETWVEMIPWRREWIPTPVFWPREFHGQKSLAGYSPWGRKDRARLSMGTHYSLLLPLTRSMNKIARFVFNDVALVANIKV